MIATLTTQQHLVTGSPLPAPSGSIYVLPPATPTVLGGVKIGANISVAGDGTISVAPPGSGAVASVFGRTGAIVAASGDYTAAQVTNAVDSTGSYPNPAWITSLAWAKLTGVPAMVNTFNGRSGAVAPATGDYTAAMVTNAVDSTQTYSDPAWLTALNWSKLTGSPSSAQISGFQTPWLQDINAGNFNLLNLKNVVIGQASLPGTNDNIYVYGSAALPSIALFNDSATKSAVRLQPSSTASGLTILQLGTSMSSSTGILLMTGMGGAGGKIVCNVSQPALGVNVTNNAMNARAEIGGGPNESTGLLRFTASLTAANDYAAMVWGLTAGSSSVHAAIKARLIATGQTALDFLAQTSGQTTIATLPLGMTVYGNAVVMTALASQTIADGSMNNSNIQFYLDEAGNNLKVRVKYSTGTLKTGTVALV